MTVTEIESPSSLSKNFVLWVDDNPRNNSNFAKNLQELYNDIEILNLTSTKSLMAWIQEYGWTIAQTDRAIKIISDMDRDEEAGNDPNAGVRLV